MGNLSNLSPAATYQDLLQINGLGLGLQTIPQNVQDGLGNNTTMTAWTTGVNFLASGGNQFQLDGVALTASAATLNNLTNVANAYYLLTTPSSQLPNSLTLTTSTGISLTASGGNYVIAPSSELAGIQAITGTGLVVRTGAGTYQTDTLTSDSTITITNPTGVAGNPYFQVNTNTSVQRINVETNGVLQSTEPTINFIPGINMGLTVVDDPFNNRANIFISATPGSDMVVGTPNQIVVSPPSPNFVISLATTLIAPGTVQVGNLMFFNNTITTENTNGDILLSPNGTGTVAIGNGLGVNVTPLQFYNSAGTQYVAFQAGTLSASTTWTLPTTDSTGTQSLVSNGSGILSWETAGGGVSSITGTANEITASAATGAVTLSIATGYVGQTSITTLGTIGTGVWQGTPVAVPFGGTGNTTFTAYSVICAGTTATGTFQNVSGLGTLGQVLTSAGTGALPTWTDPIAGVIVNQNTSSVNMVAGTQYYINNGVTLVTLTLPATAAVGDTYYIVGNSSGGWLVAQNLSQQIHLNSTATTSGTGGSLASTNQYNCITIKCIVANTTFVVFDVSGSITVT